MVRHACVAGGPRRVERGPRPDGRRLAGLRAAPAHHVRNAGLVVDSDIDGVAVDRGAPMDPAQVAARADLRVPEHVARVGVERPVDAALLPGADDIVNGAVDGRSGLITLLGDSAHPMSPFQGQGANMAINDAIILSEEITNLSNLYQNNTIIIKKKITFSNNQKSFNTTSFSIKL